jgi:hypothetical protein
MQAGKGKRQWFVHDERPRSRVPSHFVPQLQLQMAAAGLRSALFVSRSCEHGTNFFRVPRDDVYCQAMLRLVSHFYREWVCKRRRPGRDYCKGWEEWPWFCRQTHEISRGTQVLCHLAAEDTPLGQAQPLFV